MLDDTCIFTTKSMQHNQRDSIWNRRKIFDFMVACSNNYIAIFHPISHLNSHISLLQLLAVYLPGDNHRPYLT
jgi:hypothetical protein